MARISLHQPEYSVHFSKRVYSKDRCITNMPLHLVRKNERAALVCILACKKIIDSACCIVVLYISALSGSDLLHTLADIISAGLTHIFIAIDMYE